MANAAASLPRRVVHRVKRYRNSWGYRAGRKYAAGIAVFLPRRMMNWVNGHAARLPLPNMRHALMVVSLLCSIGVVMSFDASPRLSFCFLLAVLLFKWVDWLIELKYHALTETRYIQDTAAERLSEGIIFAFFFKPWFMLFTANCIIAFASHIRKTRFALPLKAIFAVYFFLTYLK